MSLPVQHTNTCCKPLPGDRLTSEKMPGHWLLARLGKRVLRPGGLELTRRMLEALAIQPTDKVVEFAPGLGITAKMTLSKMPASYTAVERDEAAAAHIQVLLRREEDACVIGSAEMTGLPSERATVVYGEAMLSMHPVETKREIIREAYRLLQRGGRYALHELCVNIPLEDEATLQGLKKELAASIHHGVVPLTLKEWKGLLEEEGFTVQVVKSAPMHLLEPQRILRDEGLFRTGQFLVNLLRDPVARKRVLNMRSVFQRYQDCLHAVMIVALKS